MSRIGYLMILLTIATCCYSGCMLPIGTEPLMSDEQYEEYLKSRPNGPEPGDHSGIF